MFIKLVSHNWRVTKEEQLTNLKKSHFINPNYTSNYTLHHKLSKS